MNVSVNDTSMHLVWQDLNCTASHGAISSYILQYVVIGVNDSAVNVMDIHSANFELASLSPCTDYSLRIAAVNRKGEIGSFSNEVNSTTAQEHSKNKGSFIVTLVEI